MSSRRVLITGPTSFASLGLPALFLERGWKVDVFGRRPSGIQGVSELVGVPNGIDLVQELAPRYDVLVNYLIVKNGDVDVNHDYLAALTRLLNEHTVDHLIHISSISVYPGEIKHVDHDSRIETDPHKKGSYGALKVAADNFLLANCPARTKLTFLRPGFILAPGLVDPMVGMALRTPLNRLLCIGAAKNTLPLTTRETVHRCVLSAAELDVSQLPDSEAFVILDPDSPSRIEYLRSLCRDNGVGQGVMHFPRWLWYTAGVGGNAVAMLAGQSIRPLKMIRNACRVQSFDSEESSRRLGVAMKLDWRKEVRSSLSEQTGPPLPQQGLRLAKVRKDVKRKMSVGLLGCGRIVKQKHLPALKRLGWNDDLLAYDLDARRDESGVEVRDIRSGEIAPRDLYLVATPGPAHLTAIESLAQVDSLGGVLVEKPLCYRPNELEAWREFSQTRDLPVSVCHNYRFKSNVSDMIDHLAAFNPGRLKQARVLFQSPPVANESAPWMRQERMARTLLMDYGLHFLDIACMFSHSPWTIDYAHAELNDRGESSLLRGAFSNSDYGVEFVLRQGFFPRQAEVQFVFQNYDCTVNFFPDIFSANMSNLPSSVLKAKGKRMNRATLRKVFDKLLGRDSDPSHAIAIALATKPSDAHVYDVSIEGLSPFYELMFELGQRLYDTRVPDTNTDSLSSAGTNVATGYHSPASNRVDAR